MERGCTWLTDQLLQIRHISLSLSLSLSLSAYEETRSGLLFRSFEDVFWFFL